MVDENNITERLEMARSLKESLEKKLELVRGTPREDEFALPIRKVDALIEHLERELGQ